MFPSYTNHSVALLCNQGILVVKGLNQETARALKLFCRRCDPERSGFRNLDLKKQVRLKQFHHQIHCKDFEEHSSFVSKGGSRAAATSKMERFAIIVNGWKQVPKFTGITNIIFKVLRMTITLAKYP